MLLQMRGRATAELLAREFGVAVRTIHRDIAALEASGVPIVAERGRAGGFALMAGYRTSLTGMSGAEAEALIIAGASSTASQLGLGAAALSGHRKLLASLPSDSRARAQRIAARFHFDPVQWYRRPAPLDLLPVLVDATWRDRQVSMRYESWQGVVARQVSPLGLVQKSDNWYLVAAHQGQARTYRVSSIKQLAVLNLPAHRPPKFELARYWGDAVAEFESRINTTYATVRISPVGLQLLREVSAAAADAVDAMVGNAPFTRSVVVEIPIESVAHATRQLLRLGAEVEVLKPATLRKAITREARAVLAGYGAALPSRNSK